MYREPSPLIPATWRRRKIYFEQAEKVERMNRERAMALKGRHDGKRAWIVANGPSISKMDLAPLRSEVVFAVNSTFRLYEQLGYEFPYTCFSDRIRWQECGEACIEASPHSTFFYCDNKEYPTPHSVISSSYSDRVILLNRYYIMPHFLQKYIFIRNRCGYSTFKCFYRNSVSFDITKGVCLGNSVIFMAMQVAAYMGCRQIILLGVDMDYSGDEKHFHGQKIFTPPMEYERDAKPWFKLFRHQFETRGIHLLNGTIGGKVDVLQRVDYLKLPPFSKIGCV